LLSYLQIPGNLNFLSLMSSPNSLVRITFRCEQVRGKRRHRGGDGKGEVGGMDGMRGKRRYLGGDGRS
jgi:hypothetical protein